MLVGRFNLVSEESLQIVICHNAVSLTELIRHVVFNTLFRIKREHEQMLLWCHETPPRRGGYNTIKYLASRSPRKGAGADQNKGYAHICMTTKDLVLEERRLNNRYANG